MISSTFHFTDSLTRLTGSRRRSVDGTVTIYANLINSGSIGDSDSRYGGEETPTAATEDRDKKKRLMPRPKLVAMCAASLYWSVLTCYHLKPHREMHGLSLAVNYIHIPLINMKLSMFNILNVLTPAVGLYGAYKQSLKAIKLFKGLLFMDFWLEFGSLVYLMTFARSLLYYKQILLLTGVGTIVSPSYFHLNAVDWAFPLAWLITAPFQILARQFQFIYTTAFYERELKDQARREEMGRIMRRFRRKVEQNKY